MEEDNEKKVVKVITEKTYVYDTGEVTEVTFVNEEEDKKKAVTNYRQESLLPSAWKPKSHFIKTYTGGRSKTSIPQFQPKGFAQYYLNTLPFIKPEENTLGAWNEDGKWYNFTKEQYQKALNVKRNTFDRFLKKCVEMNILSIYGRNDDIAIYVNPIYFFNGKQLHINLCLAFDHDNKFIQSMTDTLKREYSEKKASLDDIGEIIDI